ncbi:DinB family protein [Virgibacillus pantothenticus]|uniref:DinB family protein n=1 Tax=Virgibacillus pantothenticus TaxID=1473 RepID=UPI001C21CF7F|nr:DinB family protein [Virgibacillus pantothenticus]MBU8566198.1 DinB family protein [Virgibacillus pantothenticus]MBU8602904.1 DinB family protein [Virgibacillus pantothenticus]MBU8634668.1 DinB family protein [Virgibacillus pantothenticus]MBU8640728.1 DinB family protein [Virgibacillus pantothenticus]MBU8646517.1 DinB family protein [Virgibacillus pantothenticus]
MNRIEELVNEFAACNDWVKELTEVPEEELFQPIRKGKWSIAEIISHMTYCDRYVLEETIPQMKQDANLTSVDFEVINSKASAYAMIGVKAVQLVAEKLQIRNELVTVLREKTEQDFFATFILNGEEKDPYSGYPHTLFNYIAAFAWHDNHHKQQIDRFLLEKSK